MSGACWESITRRCSAFGVFGDRMPIRVAHYEVAGAVGLDSTRRIDREQRDRGRCTAGILVNLVEEIAGLHRGKHIARLVARDEEVLELMRVGQRSGRRQTAVRVHRY